MSATPEPLTPQGGDMTPGGDLTGALAAHWWMIALRGVIAILFGIMAFVAPVAVILSLAVLFGVYLLIDGVVGLVSAFRTKQSDQRWWLLLAEAALNIVMGGLAIVFPGGAAVAFLVITAVWALLTGGFLLAAAFRLHAAYGRAWLAIGGVISILWGVLLIAAPLAGLVVLTWWLGAYAVLFGIVLVAAAFKLRALRNEGAAGHVRP